jgi:hypothetical protein
MKSGSIVEIEVAIDAERSRLMAEVKQGIAATLDKKHTSAILDGLVSDA